MQITFRVARIPMRHENARHYVEVARGYMELLLLMRLRRQITLHSKKEASRKIFQVAQAQERDDNVVRR